jgi:hypothetical protein
MISITLNPSVWVGVTDKKTESDYVRTVIKIFIKDWPPTPPSTLSHPL